MMARASAASRRLSLAALSLAACVGLAWAQDESGSLDGRPVVRVEIDGLETISEGFVRRAVKTRPGQAFSARQLQEDYQALVRTRKFLVVQATPTAVADGVAVRIEVREKPEIVGIEIEGNKRFTDDELFAEALVVAGAPIDRYDIARSRDNIEHKYRGAGYYYVEVEIDETALENERRVVFRVIEGPRVKVRKILIEGGRSFADPVLRSKIRTQTYVWLLRVGALDIDQVERDAQALESFYLDEGYLDARVGYRLDFSGVDRTDLTLVFVVEERARYRVSEIIVEGAEIVPTERVLEVMAIKPDGVMRRDLLRASMDRIRETYGEIGYIDARVDAEYEFLEEQEDVCRVRVFIEENEMARFGLITIRGNSNTKDEVVRRELRFYPGEPFNTVATKRAERRLMESGLFDDAKITPLNDIRGRREALVEIKESQQVRFLIGGGISTDSGVIGSLTIENRNFDLFDWPRTSGEFFRGKAFRGDGQRMLFQAEPGSEVTRFRIDFTEPYLMDKPLRLDLSAYLFQRGRQPYDEQRLGFRGGLSKRFEGGTLDGWAIEGGLRFEQVDITNLRPPASDPVFEARGGSFLTSVTAAIARDTTDSRLSPSEGYRIVGTWEQVGALGGDYDFSKPSIGAAWYRTVRTDVYDRKSVFALRGDVGWILGDAPVFEKFYGGGFGSIRGFEFRGVSPRAGLLNDRVGGDFILLLGGEYQFPLYGESVRGVTFVDMGTVEESFEITQWRATAGFGLRILVPYFGPVPMVLDFGFPLTKDDQDDIRVFNFSFGASF